MSGEQEPSAERAGEPREEAASAADAQTDTDEPRRSQRDDRRMASRGRPDGRRQGDRGRTDQARQADPADDPRARDRVFNNWFFGNVHASGATFGTREAHGVGEAGGGRVEGRLEDAEVAWLVAHFAPPAGFDEAATALAVEGVIILAGAEGSGRRAGAIALLAQVRAAGQPLVALSPAVTVDKLAERSFDSGAGYLIGDMFADAVQTELAHFYWRDLCHSVREAQAYLVVTASAASASSRGDVIRQVAWHRPNSADVLRAHLGPDYTDTEVVDKAAAAIGPWYRLADIVGIARRLREGEDPQDVLATLDETDRQAVTNWLGEEDPEIPALLEVTTLAFTAGLPERLFEAELTELKTRIGEFMPQPKPRQKNSTTARTELNVRFSQLRKLRSTHPLVGIRQIPLSHAAGALTVRHVDFCKPIYRQQVVAELWSRLDYNFWVGVRAWLHDIAADDGDPSPLRPSLINSVALGLALLALVAPDEVVESYLLPWTAADASPGEQTMALYVVWQMTTLDQLAPLALQIAIAWGGQGSHIQRTLATLAFSGPLGAKYPIESIRRLGQLARQNDAMAAWAHAQLFATLTSQGADGLVVLRELTQRMKKKAGPDADLVLGMIAALVSIRDPRTGRPAVAQFLIGNPDLAGELAPLWAKALLMRPWRAGAVAAILRTLGAIEHGRAEPKSLAMALGAAIGRELAEAERPPLCAEVRTQEKVERRRKARKREAAEDADQQQVLTLPSEPLLETFLIACAHPDDVDSIPADGLTP
jgi:hypothetical protein